MATSGTRRRRSNRTQVRAQTDSGSAVADLATGALLGAADAASHPIATIRREAARLRRRGQPVNREVARDVGRTAYTTGEQAYQVGEQVITGRLAERVARRGVRLVRRQARRDDVIGDIAFGTLSAINNAVRRALGTLQRFEAESEPPARAERSTRGTSPAIGRKPAARRRSGAGSGRRSPAAAGGTASPKRRTARSAGSRRRTTPRSQSQPAGDGSSTTKPQATSRAASRRRPGSAGTSRRRSARRATAPSGSEATASQVDSVLETLTTPEAELLVTPEVLAAGTSQRA